MVAPVGAEIRFHPAGYVTIGPAAATGRKRATPLLERPQTSPARTRITDKPSRLERRPLREGRGPGIVPLHVKGTWLKRRYRTAASPAIGQAEPEARRR